MIKKGILIFAHNSQYLDYARLAGISGKLAVEKLGMPATLITDDDTVRWAKSNNEYRFLSQIFENIIISDRPNMANQRNLKDGDISERIPFINSNRNLSWDLSPYDRTLVIDSDFLVLSNNLNKYWDLDDDFLIAESASDIDPNDRLGYHDRYISDTGIKLNWATTFFFTKNEKTKVFFDLCKVISSNYQYYADLFRFDPRQYRNDIAFSIAVHILNGFSTKEINFLPPVKTFLDTDLLINVGNKKLTFLIKDKSGVSYTACSVFDRDIHVMNKQNLLRFEKELKLL